MIACGTKTVSKRGTDLEMAGQEALFSLDESKGKNLGFLTLSPIAQWFSGKNDIVFER